MCPPSAFLCAGGIILGNVDKDNNEGQVATASGESEVGALEALWSFFSSMKTAVVFLLLLVVASIAGTIIEDKTGRSIYSDTWYRTILVLVGANLAVCSINRFGLAWKRSFNPEVDVEQSRVEGMSRSEKVQFSGSVGDAVTKVVEALRSGSFRLIRQSGGETVSIYAAKGRASLWGPYLTHLSILVIFAGAIFGSLLGSEGYMTIMEGNRSDNYHLSKGMKEAPLGFQLGLISFKIKHDNMHNPTGYKSDLQVYDNGKPILRKTVDVNHPLTYKGLSFFQSDYGLVGLVVKVTAPDGQSRYLPYNIGTEDGPEGRKYVIRDDPMKHFELGGKKLTVFVHNLVPDFIDESMPTMGMLPLNPAVDVMLNDQYAPNKGLAGWKRLGWMTVGQTDKFREFDVTLQKVVSYTGLQVSRNPGLPVVFLGFGLMVLGVFMSFYVTHKMIRVSVVPSQNGATVTMGATSRADSTVFDKDFKRLHDALGG
jgi:cytochrome c biogenesis protein